MPAALPLFSLSNFTRGLFQTVEFVLVIYTSNTVKRQNGQIWTITNDTKTSNPMPFTMKNISNILLVGGNLAMFNLLE